MAGNNRAPRIVPVQLQQAVILSLFTLYAYAIGGIKHALGFVACLIAVACMVEIIALVRQRRPLYPPYSAAVTAMGIVLMLYSALWYVYLVAVIAAIGQKHLLRFEGHHLFNPSNFAVVIALALFYTQAHIQTEQLGDAYAAGAAVMMAAWIVLWEVKRWIIPLVYLSTYLIGEIVFVVAADPVMTSEDFITAHYSVAFIVFLFFMLTDPRTTPASSAAQATYAALTAALTVGLDAVIGMRVQHPFVALFLISPLVVIAQTNAARADKLRWMLGALLLTLSVIIIIEIQPPYFLDSQ